VACRVLELYARDDGRFANSLLKEWFDRLASKNGLCCAFADGVSVQDVDYESFGANTVMHTTATAVVSRYLLVTRTSTGAAYALGRIANSVWPYRLEQSTYKGDRVLSFHLNSRHGLRR
jgi:hypothetical protein